MKIKYEFATEVIEIEVGDEWGKCLGDLDREEYNNDKKETRRHLSLDTGCDQGGWLASDEHDPSRLINEELCVEEIMAKFVHLTKSQAETIKAICIEGLSVSEYAKQKGISQPAATQRLMSAKKRLKKFF